MAYEKRTWVSGTTPLSAENMNHMEEGIAAANEGVDKLNTDKSWKVLGDGSYIGGFSVHIPDDAKEIMIMATQYGGNLPHAVVNIPKNDGGAYNVTASFYYSASYFFNATYQISDYINTVSSWTIGKNGDTSLTLSAIRTYLYYRS